MAATKVTNQNHSAIGGQTITASTTTTFTELTRAIYVGTAGDLDVIMGDGSTVTIADAANGYHPLEVQVIKNTTAAADVVALF